MNVTRVKMGTFTISQGAAPAGIYTPRSPLSALLQQMVRLSEAKDIVDANLAYVTQELESLRAKVREDAKARKKRRRAKRGKS